MGFWWVIILAGSARICRPEERQMKSMPDNLPIWMTSALLSDPVC